MHVSARNTLDFKTFLINLKSSQQRLTAMTEQLANAGISFERVDAVDGRAIPAGQFKEYDETLALKRYGRPMSGPEVGCFLSHRRCIEEFLHSGQQFALVLEDDIYLPQGLSDRLIQILDCLQQTGEPWDLVNLGNPPRKYFRQRAVLSGETEFNVLSQAFYFPLGTFALLWSRPGAEAFLELSQSLYSPVDQFLRDWCAVSGRGFALSPSIIGVDRSQSYIRHRLVDRLRLNLARYWVVKNLRLLKNQRQAWQTLQFYIAAGDCDNHSSLDNSWRRCA